MIHSLPHKEIPIRFKKTKETKINKPVREKPPKNNKLFTEKDEVESSSNDNHIISVEELVLLITFILLSEEPEIDPTILAIVLFLMFED